MLCAQMAPSKAEQLISGCVFLWTFPAVPLSAFLLFTEKESSVDRSPRLCFDSVFSYRVLFPWLVSVGLSPAC